MDAKTISKIVTVSKTGQISIGTQWAGKTVKIEEKAGEVSVTAVTVIPDRDMIFFTPASMRELDDFNEWQRTAAQETDEKKGIAELRKERASYRAKKSRPRR